jgi:CheY-like chemotaxis protein
MVRSILLICDVRANFATRKSTLEGAGYKVTGANDEAEGMKLLSNNRYDLVILEGMGTNNARNNLNRKATKTKPRTPVAIILKEGEQDGLADAVITNPKNSLALLEIVMGIFASHHPEQ